jgi:hypothetical protein
MTDWASLRYAVVDVEGNGQRPPDLVELATVPIVAGIIGEPVSWLVKPDTAITRMAARVHGLNDQDVASAPMSAQIKTPCSTHWMARYSWRTTRTSRTPPRVVRGMEPSRPRKSPSPHIWSQLDKFATVWNGLVTP